ncbi:S-layer homology domain-containing protein [Flavonifractor hominis]|uniref:S-layer homology domain-containing protein n=1 Tax=Flavonifractor hominis TaxID=3133178 RepID=A0ABV1ESD2_9FIRM
MNKKLTVLVLTGALACAMALPAMAAETTAVPISAPVSMEETMSLPDSVLYYGTVQEIVKDENGNITQLRMVSDRYGEYVMNITEQTVWIDSGRHAASDPTDLQEGESVYVFHSSVETRSLPPQSAAFAVVRNIPMDAGCAQYHEVEEVSLQNGQLKITTDNGGLFIFADDETELSMYRNDAALSLEDIQVGNHVIAWYGAVADSYPGQAHASYLMLLPGEVQIAEETVTRGELAMMMYEQAGKPSVDFAMEYSDVADDAQYAEAIRWVTSKGYMGGYGDGTFGPDDAVSREQLVTILWRYEGSPMLMDYAGLTQFSDVGDISLWAQPAFAWGHQRGYISAVEEGILAPKGDATQEMAETILSALAK